MLKVHSLSKSFGDQQILVQVSFNLNRGERLALVGPNGCGKSTLLKILSGIEQADSGGFQLSPPSLRLAYLPQGLVADPSATIAGYLDRASEEIGPLEGKLEALSSRLVFEPDQPALQLEFDQTLAAIQAISQSGNQRTEVLDALGLDHLPASTPLSHLSGGQKTRLALAGLLLSSPDILLLDEPTNHLDIEMLEWLETWLVNSPPIRRSGVILVSHDRIFLDNIATGVLEIDPTTHRLRSFQGSYSAFLEAKLSEIEKHHQMYTDQQEEIARLRRASQVIRGKAAFRRGGKGDSGDKFAKGFFANRTKEHVARARHIEARLEKLLGEEHIDKPSQTWGMKLEFESASKSSRQAVVLEELSVGYGEKPLLEGLNLTVRYGQRIALIGPNGSGKTTLMRTIAGALPPISGRVRLGQQIRPGYSTQEQEMLDPGLNPLQTLLKLAPQSETEARSFLHKYLFSGEDVFVRVADLSFGERARLMLACLVASGSNLLLLDEPINHLDIPSRERFERALAVFDGTVIAVVHDRYFISNFATRIWEIQAGELQDIPLQ